MRLKRHSFVALPAACFLLAVWSMVPIAQGQGTAPATTTDSPGATALTQIHRMIDSGHPEEALKRIEILRAEQPVPKGLDRLQGTALYAQGRVQEASAAFAAAVKADAKDDESRQMLGLTLYRLGKPAEAIPYLQSAHQWTEQTKTDPSYVLALCYMDTRRYDDARSAFAAQYGFAADSASAYLLAARMLLRREYVPVAQEFARKALALNPELPLAHQLLGEVALAGEHLDEAIRELEMEKARNPLNGGVYDRLGDAYLRAGQYEMAQQSLQRALLLEPNSTGPYILLGKALLKRQDAANAATYLERAVKMDPANFMSHSLLGQAYRLMGRTEDASRETQTAQKIQSMNEPKLETLH